MAEDEQMRRVQMRFQLEHAAYHLEQGRARFEELVQLSDDALIQPL
jgi:hypothetical protein